MAKEPPRQSYKCVCVEMDGNSIETCYNHRSGYSLSVPTITHRAILFGKIQKQKKTATPNSYLYKAQTQRTYNVVTNGAITVTIKINEMFSPFLQHSSLPHFGIVSDIFSLFGCCVRPSLIGDERWPPRWKIQIVFSSLSLLSYIYTVYMFYI